MKPSDKTYGDKRGDVRRKHREGKPGRVCSSCGDPIPNNKVTVHGSAGLFCVECAEDRGLFDRFQE